MRKHINTVYDYFDEASDHELLKQVAIILARQDQDYREAYYEKSLQEDIAAEMLYNDQKSPANNYLVTVQFVDEGVSEESTYRGRSIKSVIDGLENMGLEDYVQNLVFEDYVQNVINPVSTELAARVVSKLARPLKATDYELNVRNL